jgi:probable F420-dependent oxidoreductase
VVGLQVAPELALVSELAMVMPTTEALGYDALWFGEVSYVDVIAQAAVAATVTTDQRVGALLNVFTRSPTNAAMAASALASLAPGRSSVVLGASSPLLVQRWNGIAYERPYARVQDYLRFLRSALAGERPRGAFSTFSSDGFRLVSPPAEPPAILIAAAMPRSMRLAASDADGVVLNWAEPADIERLPDLPTDRDRIWLSIIVCPTDDPAVVDRQLRPLVADYLSAPAYAGLQRAAGREPLLTQMWSRFAAGDREGAHRALPTQVLQRLVISGTPQSCGRQLRDIEHDLGIHVLATLMVPEEVDAHAALAGIADGFNPR